MSDGKWLGYGPVPEGVPVSSLHSGGLASPLDQKKTTVVCGCDRSFTGRSSKRAWAKYYKHNRKMGSSGVPVFYLRPSPWDMGRTP